MSFNMYVPTRFMFGNGCLGELHQQNLPAKKALLLIAKGKSVRESGALARTLGLAGLETALFAGIGAGQNK